jgi:hypothetical protein
VRSLDLTLGERRVQLGELGEDFCHISTHRISVSSTAQLTRHATMIFTS